MNENSPEASKVDENTVTAKTTSPTPAPKANVIQQHSNEKSPLNPREIQQFIRSGLSAEELQAKYNVPLENIRKFSMPIEHEKAVVINLFQSLPARRAKKGRTLLDVTNEWLDENGISRELQTWSATKDGRKPWLISLTFSDKAGTKSAAWYWDSKNSVISENNDLAKSITKYYEDATDDSDDIAIGSARTRLPERTDWSMAQHSRVRNLTGRLRLRELDRIKDELNKDFDDLKSTVETVPNPESDNIANSTPKTSENIVEKTETKIVAPKEEATITEVPKTTEKPKSAPNASTFIPTSATVAPEKPPVKSSVVPKNASAGFVEPPKSVNITSEIINETTRLTKENSALFDPSLQVTEQFYNNTQALDISDNVSEDLTNLNVTGRLRSGMRRKSKSRSSVPSWENVMMPKSNLQKRFDNND